MTLPSAFANKEIWFLTGSQSLYGPEILETVAKQSMEVVATLQEHIKVPLKLVSKPVLLTPESIRRIILEANIDDNCVGVITWMHTFSPAKMWISGINALQKPLLHFNTQVNQTLPWRTIDMDFMNLNQAAHGDREYGHIVTRFNKSRKVVAGHSSEKHVIDGLSTWMRAAVGWNVSQNLKLARFGDNMRYVAVTDGDKTSAQMKLGISIESYGVNSLVEEVARVTAPEIDATVAEYESEYDVAKELKFGGDRHESLRYAAAIEVALEKFLVRGGFSAFTTNFEDLGGLRQLPGIAVQRLMAKGYGFGGEGDWKTSALLRIVNGMTEGLVGGNSFMEDYTYHFGPGEAKVLGAHMLEVSPAITLEKPRIEIHPLGIGDREDPVRMIFNATPGAGRVIALTDLGDRFRLTSNDIEIVNPDEPLDRLPVASAVWKPSPNLSTSAECWIYAGGSHHTVLTTSLTAEVLHDYAKIAGVELLSINSSTTTGNFEKEILWNSKVFS